MNGTKHLRFYTVVTSIVYFVGLVYTVFFSYRRRHPHHTRRIVNLIPVKGTIHNYNIQADFGVWNFYSNIIGNVALFIPLPIIMIVVLNITNFKRIIVLAVIFSCTIEMLQYIFFVGVADVDDVVLNTIGALIGIGIYKGSKKYRFLKPLH